MPQHGKLHKSQEVLLVVLLFAGAIGDCAAQGFPPCAPSSGAAGLDGRAVFLYNSRIPDSSKPSCL